MKLCIDSRRVPERTDPTGAAPGVRDACHHRAGPGLCVGLLWVLLAVGARAETVRVTTWNLGFDAHTESRGALMEVATDTLRQLSPDVILLQGVTDWRMCQQLAWSLHPDNYNVLICSAFPQGVPFLPAKPQVAILARRKAYFAWTEAWPSQQPEAPSGGVAFAAIDAGSQRLGFFSALLADSTSEIDSAQRILNQVNSVNKWETNQIQTFVIAASCEPYSTRSADVLNRASSVFGQAGFIDASETIPADYRATLQSTNGLGKTVADILVAGPMGFPSRPHITPSAVFAHYPVTCDIELDQDQVTAAKELRAEARRQSQTRTSWLSRDHAYWVGGAAAVVAAFLILRAKARRVRRSIPARKRLPVRIIPGNSPPQLRPVIFAQPPPPAPAEPSNPVLSKAPRPVLRLQGSRTEPPAAPAHSETDSPPPAPVRPSQVPQRQEPLNPQAVLACRECPVTAQAQVTALRQGLIRELSLWLKHKLVRKLITDRTQLMEAQRLATRMATTLDNRLARIEAQIQDQNQAYIRRIEELNKELAAAREENRELIRERIAQVKAEMEAARARVLAEADLDKGSFRL